MGTTIYVASTASADLKYNIHILLNSLKHLKQPDTIVHYFLFVPSVSIRDFQQYLTGIPDDTFHVAIMDIDWFVDKVHCPAATVFHYARCLFADVFLQLDKILYLDADTVIAREGIEDLWNIDLGDNYVAGCIDTIIQFAPFHNRDLHNTGVDEYINSGVMLMNLAQIRADRANEEMADWLMHWNERKDRLRCYVYDQTLINYLWHGHIKVIDMKFNCNTLAAWPAVVPYYQKYMASLGYATMSASAEDAVILHFFGMLRPWKESCRRLSTAQYPFHDEAIAYWDRLAALYGPGPQMPAADSEDIYPPMSVTVVKEDTGLSLTVQTPIWWTEGF